MFTTIAYSESQDEAGVMTRMAAVPDQHIKTVGDIITIPHLNQIIGAFAAVGTLGDEARLISPSLRRTNPLYITPISNALNVGATPAMHFHPENPIPLTTNESLEAENDADPAAPEQHTIVVWLADGVILPITGEIFTINAHITLAQVVGSWEFSEITFPDSLPVADYSIVGARLLVAAGIVFRFVPVGGINRPGGLVCPSIQGITSIHQRFGGLGEWLKFNTVQPPGVELLGSAPVGSATYELYIDVIKL